MSFSKEKRSKDLDNMTYPSKCQHLNNNMDRNFSFEKIEPDIEPNIEFDKINNDNIDDDDDKTNRDKNKDKKENQGSSILNSIDKDDKKGSKVWNHFDKFVNNRKYYRQNVDIASMKNKLLKSYFLLSKIKFTYYYF